MTILQQKLNFIVFLIQLNLLKIIFSFQKQIKLKIAVFKNCIYQRI
jgi:hypothetical protein